MAQRRVALGRRYRTRLWRGNACGSILVGRRHAHAGTELWHGDGSAGGARGRVQVAAAGSAIAPSPLTASASSNSPSSCDGSAVCKRRRRPAACEPDATRRSGCALSVHDVVACGLWWNGVKTTQRRVRRGWAARCQVGRGGGWL